MTHHDAGGGVVSVFFSVLLLFGGAAIGSAQVPGSANSRISLPISCSAEAQREFTRGVTLLHHMTYPRAREAFEGVLKVDPRCAMGHWGLAMTLFQPLWPTRPTPADLQRGWEATRSAGAASGLSPTERLMVDAATEFFRDPGSTDYWVRIRRWEDAMARAYAAFPRDHEVATFYALAHLAAAPQDSVLEHSSRAAEILLQVYAEDPDHPGAMHYLVHANDAPGREGISLDVTRKYESSAPSNPHALHMPTHIHTRLGDWEAVITGNRLAAEAALAHPAGDSGQFIWDEFPHAVEYLIYAFLQQGQDDSASAELNRLREAGPLQPSFKTAFHMASTRARYVLERRAWEEAVALSPREPAALDWDRFAWPEAITWYARGLGAAHLGQRDELQASEERLGVLEGVARESGESLFAANIQVLRLEVQAWRAHTEGDGISSVDLLMRAAELEVATPKHAVTPAPTLPAFELLGDLFMEQGRPADALASYIRSLQHHPLRLNSLLGAARAAAASGNETVARLYYEQLLETAGSGTRHEAVDEARTYLRR